MSEYSLPATPAAGPIGKPRPQIIHPSSTGNAGAPAKAATQSDARHPASTSSVMNIQIRGMKRRDVMILTTLLSAWSAQNHFDAEVTLTGHGPSCCLHGKTAGGPAHIPAERILYLTSDGHYVQAAVLSLPASARHSSAGHLSGSPLPASVAPIAQCGSLPQRMLQDPAGTYITTRTVRMAMTFREAQEQLHGTQFLHCGRGVILNMNGIRGLEHGGFRMQDGTVFPLPSHRKRETAAAYQAYLQSLLYLSGQE